MRSKMVVTALVGLLLLSPAALRVSLRIAVLPSGGTSLQGPPSLDLVVKTVMAHADNVLPEDELLELNGIWVKKSNYHGVALGDRTYLYCLAPHACNCPVCRGVLGPTAANRLHSDESTDFPMTIYTPHFDDSFLEPIGTPHDSRAFDE